MPGDALYGMKRSARERPARARQSDAEQGQALPGVRPHAAGRGEAVDADPTAAHELARRHGQRDRAGRQAAAHRRGDAPRTRPRSTTVDAVRRSQQTADRHLLARLRPISAGRVLTSNNCWPGRSSRSTRSTVRTRLPASSATGRPLGPRTDASGRHRSTPSPAHRPARHTRQPDATARLQRRSSPSRRLADDADRRPLGRPARRSTRRRRRDLPAACWTTCRTIGARFAAGIPTAPMHVACSWPAGTPVTPSQPLTRFAYAILHSSRLTVTMRRP